MTEPRARLRITQDDLARAMDYEGYEPTVEHVWGHLEAFVADAEAEAAGCQRCAEIRAASALDLVVFWAPRRTPTEKDGEIIRKMALEEHAKWGHPTELELHR